MKLYMFGSIIIRILADTRPVWWISETDAYTNLLRPDMRQTQHSCETTPGCPSGHTMFNAALMYVILSEVLKSQTNRSAKAYRYLNVTCWTLLSLHLVLVSASRMYFGCHFLHQCILGIVLGVGCSKYILGPSEIVNRLMKADASKLWLINAALVAIALAIYLGHILIGADPLWSIRTVSERR